MRDKVIVVLGNSVSELTDRFQRVAIKGRIAPRLNQAHK